MKKVFLVLVLISCTQLINAQSINVRFDLDNAVETIKLMRQKEISEKEMNYFLSLPGTKAIIRKINSHPDTARSAMKKILAGQPGTRQENNFQYSFIYKNIDTMEAFVKRLDANKNAIIDSITKALLPYVSTGKKMDVTVYGTLGGYSMGYTFSEDNTFYLGLHFYKGDMPAVLETSKHELFHNIQSANYNFKKVNEALEKKHKGASMAHALINYLYLEGTAEFVSDMRKLQKTPKVKELVEHSIVNDYRTGDVFYLFERMVLDNYRNSDSTDFNKAYSILFDWNWNNPGYYLGYRMMKSLEAAYGPDALKKYIAADPTLFILDYIELSKTQKDKAPFSFSSSFENAVRQIAGMVKTI